MDRLIESYEANPDQTSFRNRLIKAYVDDPDAALTNLPEGGKLHRS
jgi:hypothetical protein